MLVFFFIFACAKIFSQMCQRNNEQKIKKKKEERRIKTNKINQKKKSNNHYYFIKAVDVCFRVFFIYKTSNKPSKQKKKKIFIISYTVCLLPKKI